MKWRRTLCYNRHRFGATRVSQGVGVKREAGAIEGSPFKGNLSCPRNGKRCGFCLMHFVNQAVRFENQRHCQ